MRKKKLIEQIRRLEDENQRLKDNEDYWKDVTIQQPLKIT